MKVLFAGTPKIAADILENLIKSDHDIVGVYTQPDRPAGRGRKLTPSAVKQLAVDNNIRVEQPLNFKDKTSIETLKNYQADVMIVVAYGLILPLDVLQTPKHGCINIHMSLLPHWRGAAPIQHAILAGDKETGVTIMQMDTGLDTGPILEQIPCAIDPKDSSERLHNKLAKLSPQALLDVLDKLDTGILLPVPQDESKASYAHKIQKEDARIDWNQSAKEIQQQIMAYNPWPVAFTEIDNKIIRIWQGHAVEGSGEPGTILAANKEGITICTKQDAFCVTELQLPGKRAIAARDVLNAHKDLFLPGVKL